MIDTEDEAFSTAGRRGFESSPAEKGKEDQEMVVFRPADQLDGRTVEIEKSPNWWTVRNERLEQMVRQTDVDNEQARERIYDVLKKWHIPKKLEDKGAKVGDQIRIGEEFWDLRL